MDYKELLFMVISPINACLTIILNAIIIYFMLAVIPKQKMRRLVYFLNLAVSDLVLGFIILLVKVLKSMETKDPTNQVLLDVRMFFQMKVVSLSLYISVMSIAAITIERLILVSYPFHYTRLRFGKKSAICVFMWVASAALVIPMHFYIKNDSQEYILTPTLIIVTMAMATISYLKIRKALSERRRIIAVDKRSSKITAYERCFTEFCARSIVLFFACWLPICIFGILFSSGMLTDWEYLMEFRFTVHVVAFSNSVLSPILFLTHFGKSWCKEHTDKMNTEMKDLSVVFTRQDQEISNC